MIKKFTLLRISMTYGQRFALTELGPLGIMYI